MPGMRLEDSDREVSASARQVASGRRATSAGAPVSGVVFCDREDDPVRCIRRWAGTCIVAVLAAGAMEAVACSGTHAPSGFGGANDAGDGRSGPTKSDSASGPDTGSNDDGGGSPLTPTKDAGRDTEAPATAAVVYAESPDTLYKLDPSTNAISAVARFSGDCAKHVDCADVIDIALDKASNGYASTGTSLYEFDVKTGVTKLIASKGNYPNSLSFVPKGTLDPTEEALVGYQGIHLRAHRHDHGRHHGGRWPHGWLLLQR